jgi:hypothetical protein
MMEKIKAHFLKFGARQFVWCAVILLFILDLANSWFLRFYWLKKDFSTTLVHQAILKQNYAIENFSLETIQEMRSFLDNMFYFFLLLIMVNNLFFYIFYLRRKLWAQGYVLFYTLTAAIFALSFIFDHAGLSTGWMIYNLMTIPIYVYLYLGVKLLKRETTSDSVQNISSPGDETKAQ